MLLNFGAWLYMERGSGTRLSGWERIYLFFLLWLVELLLACSGCDAWLSKSAARKPASIGRLRAGRPGTRVNSGLAGRCSGDARFTRGSGQVWRRILWWSVAGSGVAGIAGL